MASESADAEGSVVDISWLSEEDKEPFKSALAASESWAGIETANAQDLRNSVSFLESLLERATFPDDEEARRLKQELEGPVAPLFSEGKVVWPGKRGGPYYDTLRRLRADYDGTIRGDLENRVDRLRSRESRIVERAAK